MAAPKRSVVVAESAEKPYGQTVTIGRHILSADESEGLGGHDVGPSPYEYVMVGLGACTAMTLRMYADRLGWSLEKTSVEVSHKLVVGSDGKTAADRFERAIRVEGNLTAKQREELLQVADRCPVSRTLQRPSIIVTAFADRPGTN